MMITLPFLVPLLSLVTTLFMISGVISTSFTIANNCSYTVWPALVSSNNGPEIPLTGFKLETGDFTTTSAAAWSGYGGRIWGRTYCTKDPTGNFSCLTGDCGTGKVECAGAQFKAPATLAEFSLNISKGNDFYDVSLVDGFNLPLLVVPQGGSGGSCNATGCVVDVNQKCPSELKFLSTVNRSMVVGCKSACDSFGTPEYCCTGAGPCKPSSYSRIFKQACPYAYSYALDDATSTFTCPSANYVITFCPSATTGSSYSSSSPAPPPLVEPPLFRSPPVETPPTLLPPTTFNTSTSNTKNKSRLPVYISVPSVIAVLATLALWCFCFRKKKAMKKFLDDEIQSAKSLQFSFNAISIATDDFSDANKLGEGGFGFVYKGVLLDGQEIAVKRLSKSSGQGDREFKTEVILLAKLEHRNLVRLLGFCLEEEEKLLIYEFMPNASLDQFIFDPIKRTYLTWDKRFKIIGGIARGLLYLHEESRLKIIHRDLKANNILLDDNMTPKISDFGMARLFEVDQTQANTNKIVGTYGYMAPEYVKHGQFSVKSDVFSFGVLVLEIISGKKNTSFYESEVAPDLLSYAWINLKNGKGFELVDESLRDNCSKREVMRCIHIGMLCVQENICDRPTMASVVLMLNSYSTTLPLLASPAFFASSNEPTIDLRRGEEEAIVLVNPPWSLNEASLTDPYPR